MANLLSLRAIAAVVLILAGAGGAYYYFMYLPEMERESAAHQAVKSPASTKTAKPPVAQRTQAASAVAAVSEHSAPMHFAPVAVTPPNPISAEPSVDAATATAPSPKPVPEQTIEPVKPELAVRKPAPKKPRIKAPPMQPARMGTEPSVPARTQQLTPPLSEVLPESGIVAEPVSVPRIATPKYNDVLTAVLRRDRDAVKELLDLGRWADKPGSSGLNPLMAAVMNRDSQMVQLLLEHGAIPSSQALKLARDKKDTETAKLLEQQSAR